LWVRALGHRTVSFEPNPINCLRLCESLALNNWTDDEVNVYAYGVGANIDNLPFLMHRYDNPGAGGFVRSDEIVSTAATGAEGHAKIVPVITLNSFAEDSGWFVTAAQTPSMVIPILKVDVEGLDPQVFMGADRLLKSGIVKNIMMEYSCDMSAKADMYNVAKQIISATYRIKLIGRWNGAEIPGSLEQVNANKNGTVSGLYELCIQRKEARKSSAQLNLWWSL
jgi:FkbM family methyltransferase